ncbi:site-specific integrase [Oxalobacter sp. OttesenSCG-928-P03]|nr:site-specific integrase [Oxalobacter sp. OttesenSCG-928-P03]
MASITKRGDSWFAQVRRKGHRSISKSFPKKSQAVEWARGIEAEIDAKRFQDTRSASEWLFSELIDRYTEEIGAIKKFGKSKVDVLRMLKTNLGDLSLNELTEQAIMAYADKRLKAGAGGVTVSIDLTYISTILKTAKQLWKMPVSIDPVQSVRQNLRYMGVNLKSTERDRRPTQEEIDALIHYFDSKPRRIIPMGDIIQFAIETAMRASEITGLLWSDLNEKDKTILIRSRKHPQKKEGNDQEVPLLGKAFDIVMRQPRVSDRIFPYGTKTFSSIFPRACNKLKIEDLRFHDLRHEGISRLFEQGYRIEQVRLVSGHQDVKMLFRYVQVRAKDLHR